MKTNIKVSLEEATENPNYDANVALEKGIEYTVPKYVKGVRSVDLIINGDAEILNDIVDSIPKKYKIT